MREPWTTIPGPGPLVGFAVHAGHELRPEVEELTRLTPEERRREEDPFTERFAALLTPNVVVHRSRFEVDLNRSLEEAVYLEPEDAWGLDVWKTRPDPAIVERSRALHRRFYENARRLLEAILAVHGKLVVYDVHSYNHRRGGPQAPPAPAEENPQINLGTGTMDRQRWAPVCDAFLETVRGRSVQGSPVDARENVRFLGGYLPRWIHTEYPERGCALAVEIKKTFMDEWTGEPKPVVMDELLAAIEATIPAVRVALGRMGVGAA